MAKRSPQPIEETPVTPTESSTPTPENPAVPETPPVTVPGEATESHESLAAHVESQAPEPNQEAIARATEKKNRRGEGQEGKKRGSYKRDKKAKVDEFGKPKIEMTEEEKEAYVRHYQSGEETVDGSVNLASSTLGPVWDWLPAQTITFPDGSKRAISERQKGREVFGKLFAYNKWDGPNPNVSAFLFVVGYLAVRLKQPDNREKLKGFVQKMMDKWKASRKAKAQAVETAIVAESKPKAV